MDGSLIDAATRHAARRASEDDAVDFAVVIPAFNEIRTIRPIVEQALAFTPWVTVVDDGSTDGTAEALSGLPITLLRQETNRGKAAALIRGLQSPSAHKGGGVVTLDGDGQHRPGDIRRLVEAAQDAPGRIIVGSRLHDASHFPKARLIANKIANFWISWAAGQAIADTQSGFRFYPASLLHRIDWSRLKGEGFVFESEVLIHAAECGVPCVSVEIPALYDREAFRPSHFRPARDITAIVKMVAVSLLRRGLYPVGLYRSLTAGDGTAKTSPSDRAQTRSD